MSNDVITLSDDNLPMLGNDTLLQLAAKAEKQIEAIKTIKSVVLKVTNPQDWVDQNGRPYLQASGGEKVARIFGISWTIGEPLLETEPDGHFAYTYKGVFTLQGISIEAIGTRSSKDGFFKKYGQDAQSGEKTTLPPSEIDKGDVKKSAYTNLIGNGITRLLGIRNLTWEEVTAGGIDKSKTGHVTYKGAKDQNVNSDVSATRQEYNQRVEEALKRLYAEDKGAMKTKVIELTTWTNNKGETVKGIANYLTIKSDKSVEILCHKLEQLSPRPTKQEAPDICVECRRNPCVCEKEPGQEPPEEDKNGKDQPNTKK